MPMPLCLSHKRDEDVPQTDQFIDPVATSKIISHFSPITYHFVFAGGTAFAIGADDQKNF
jgi:hypothetical protein